MKIRGRGRGRGRGCGRGRGRGRGRGLKNNSDGAQACLSVMRSIEGPCVSSNF